MALLHAPRDPPISLVDPLITARPARYGGGWMPLILAAIISVAIMAMLLPRSAAVVGDNTSAGVATVQAVTPAPSPTTEPRPTQAPIQ